MSDAQIVRGNARLPSRVPGLIVSPLWQAHDLGYGRRLWLPMRTTAFQYRERGRLFVPAVPVPHTDDDHVDSDSSQRTVGSARDCHLCATGCAAWSRGPDFISFA